MGRVELAERVFVALVSVLAERVLAERVLAERVLAELVLAFVDHRSGSGEDRAVEWTGHFPNAVRLLLLNYDRSVSLLAATGSRATAAYCYLLWYCAIVLLCYCVIVFLFLFLFACLLIVCSMI